MEEKKQIKISTGVQGLDEVLMGGFIQGNTILLRGGPGVGKTTLGIQYLLEGIKQNQTSLFITLGESIANIKKNISQLGLKLDKINFLDLSPEPDYFSKVQSYDIFTPAEVEREPTTKLIVETIERLKPERIFVDAITQFKFLSLDNFQFRKQILSFLHFLQSNNSTVLFTTETSQLLPDDDLQFMADAVINLENTENGRFLFVTKFRGSDYLTGRHGYKIGQNGIQVFANVIPQNDFIPKSETIFSSGNTELDKLLGGGIESGTINIFTGPSGVGKTTLAVQFAKNISKMNFNTDIYSFEEEKLLLLNRCKKINLDIDEQVSKGNLEIHKIEPLLYSADEFLHLVFNNATKRNVSLVVIDSTAGFKLSLNGKDIVSKLHTLSKRLQSVGIASILINEVENITGDFKITEERLSYLSDNIIFLRYLEIDGKLRKAIGVIKKRMSDFEKNLREFEITSNGIAIGQPLTNLRGILLGVPHWKQAQNE